MTARPPMACFFLLAIAAALAGCSSMDTLSSPDFDAASVTSYAWKRSPQISGPMSTDNDRVLDDVRRTVSRELEARGVKRVTPGMASVLVDAVLTVEERLQENDPNFSLFLAEKWEQGTLTIRLLDPATDGLLWEGSCGHRLRYVSRSPGGTAPRFEPTGERRDWRMDELVERLIGAALTQ